MMTLLMRHLCGLATAMAALCVSVAVRGETGTSAPTRGAQTFGIYCAACHGDGATGALGPALTNLAMRKDSRPVAEIIRKPSPAMPPLYPATINDNDIADIEAYLLSIQVAPANPG